ncbi:hypothetical protein CZ774_08980 [Frigoribacterium sp. JB110]|nr:hypothetical protein CZ774_08980 [Frigoribacterium sp. JB110]
MRGLGVLSAREPVRNNDERSTPEAHVPASRFPDAGAGYLTAEVM